MRLICLLSDCPLTPVIQVGGSSEQRVLECLSGEFACSESVHAVNFSDIRSRGKGLFTG